MKDDSGYNGSALGWFLLGSIAGACAGLLMAPATGKRTRERLARTLRDTRESMTDLTDDLADRARHIAEKAGRLGNKAIRLAGEVPAKAREIVGSPGVHAKRAAKP